MNKKCVICVKLINIRLIFDMIHYFNPGHEAAVLNTSKYYMPPSNVVCMQNDLSFLPAWYANSGDFILVNETPPNEFIDLIKKELDIQVQSFSIKGIDRIKNKLINQQVRLWGISPQAIHLFDTINSEYNLNLSLPVWSDGYRNLCDRHTAHNCLTEIVNSDNYFPKDIIPTFFSSLEDIEQHVHQNPTIKYLAKAPFSSSGRGLLWLPVGELTRTEKQILHGFLKKQGSISIEQVLNKKTDFAMEFFSENQDVHFIGYSLFETNSKGNYLGNFIGKQEDILKKINEYIPISLLTTVKEKLIAFIKKNIAPIYKGYIGVDMMIYHDNSEYKLHPCLEINIRNNMGIIALNLSKRIVDEKSQGHFYIEFRKENGGALKEHLNMLKEHPAIFNNKKLKSGYLSLCPITEKTKYRAYIIINEKQ